MPRRDRRDIRCRCRNNRTEGRTYQSAAQEETPTFQSAYQKETRAGMSRSVRVRRQDVDNLIEHFRNKDLEMLHEIISPEAFPRPLIEDYTTLSSICAVVRNANTKRVSVDTNRSRFAQ
jgi:hypothetical protein